MKDRAIVLTSGGLDSTVTLAVAISMGYDPYMLHVSYSQRTEAREFKAVADIASFYNISNKMNVNIDYLAQIGGTALIDKSVPINEGFISENSQVPNTYVPFRNANILSIAVSWAEVVKANKIFIGVVEEDSSGYPDCTEIFYQRFNSLLEVALANQAKLEVLTPLIHLSKGEIVRKGVELNAPLHLSWSCYQAEDKACGVCESCLLRLKGFKEAGYEDQIAYAK